MTKKTIVWTASLMLMASVAHAQAIPTPTERKIADVASYITWGSALALDFKDSWDDADRVHALQLYGARVFTTWVAATALKELTHAPRPCAPSCGIDDPLTDFPSLHTAFTFSTVEGGRHWKQKLILAAATGILRRASNKHDWLGVAGGIGLGAITGSIR